MLRIALRLMLIISILSVLGAAHSSAQDVMGLPEYAEPLEQSPYSPGVTEFSSSPHLDEEPAHSFDATQSLSTSDTHEPPPVPEEIPLQGPAVLLIVGTIYAVARLRRQTAAIE